MITHDELIYCIQQQYPDAVHGTDFLVGMPLDENTGEQLGEALVLAWSLDGLKLKESDLWPLEPDRDPSPEAQAVIAAVDALVAQHAADARLYVLGWYARMKRDVLLRDSDGPYLRGQERGEDVTALLSYRNALRDLPEQPGFPETIVWPELPAA